MTYISVKKETVQWSCHGWNHSNT